MTYALRWAAKRAILMFHNCEGQSHRTVSTDHSFWRERRAEADSNRGPSAYQPNALPLGQTGSHGKSPSTVCFICVCFCCCSLFFLFFCFFAWVWNVHAEGYLRKGALRQNYYNYCNVSLIYKAKHFLLLLLLHTARSTHWHKSLHI